MFGPITFIDFYSLIGLDYPVLFLILKLYFFAKCLVAYLDRGSDTAT